MRPVWTGQPSPQALVLESESLFSECGFVSGRLDGQSNIQYAA